MFAVTFIEAIFGTIIYFRPATIATDCGGDVTFASIDCDCDCVIFVVVDCDGRPRVVDPLPYKLLLSSFEFRLLAAVIELVLDALLPLCNVLVGPVVLLFRDERSRCLVVDVVTVASDPNN